MGVNSLLGVALHMTEGAILRRIAIILQVSCTIYFISTVLYENFIIKNTPFSDIFYAIFSIFVIINNIGNVRLILNSKA
ncbi:hypothetical protein [Piscirickettsia salmonis]|uniref:hypothetical protein n=1 Tax=Piscirickettsia salmonis TaxID=1238 RepID=UPI0018ACF87D|nr:hypothetical protein [Piscirickettsia salmonis]